MKKQEEYEKAIIDFQQTLKINPKLQTRSL